MKKIISLFLSIVLCVGILPLNVWAAEEETEISPEMLASDLKTLGLFKGVSDTDFSLDRKPTRTEAIVMLIRVLGQEETALTGTWEHPFDDVPTWAVPYVGYAYTKGLTGGISATKFGSNNIVPDYMYLTFVLRALGYSDANGDFVWNDPYKVASEAGILPKEYDKNNFLRRDVALISYAALNALMKGTQNTLADTLIASDIFTQEEFDSVYRFGAVKLNISPFTEVRKMIRQYGEYDKKNGVYSLHIIQPRTNTEYSSFTKYDESYTFSYSEATGNVLLREDLYTYWVSTSGGKRSEQEGTAYCTMQLVESADAYEVKKYERDRFVTSGGKINTLEAVGEFYPHKWDRYLDHHWTWMQMEFTIKDNPLYGTFRTSFAMDLQLLLEKLQITMNSYGLTTQLEDLGFDVEPYKIPAVDKYEYESPLSESDIQRLREYDMTTDPVWHTTYSEALKRYDENQMHNYYDDRTGPFNSFQEAHDYLEIVMSPWHQYNYDDIGLNVSADSYEVFINLVMAEAAAEMAYSSEAMEISFYSNKELLYHPDCQGSYSITVRGVGEFHIKDKTKLSWDDRTAIQELFFYDGNYSGYKLSELPEYVDLDIHMRLVGSSVVITYVSVLGDPI